MTVGEPLRARIRARVYKSGDGLRWSVESSARGRRTIAVSSESYARKADAFRGLLLTTGGQYESETWFLSKLGGAYEQGYITRTTPYGMDERIFVEYVGGAQ